jgi:hypothetical protein
VLRGLRFLRFTQPTQGAAFSAVRQSGDPTSGTLVMPFFRINLTAERY